MSELIETAESGLRQRKKAQRREDIIAAARHLFAREGIDATTMADIAAAAVISTPTVFNYFGSKDGILMAMIEEGTRSARDHDQEYPVRAHLGLETVVLDLFERIAAQTLNIAGKQVWRYTEAAVIRNSQTDLAQAYRAVSQELLLVIAAHFDRLDLITHHGDRCPTDYVARVFHDLWMPCFIELITDDDMTLADHATLLRLRLSPAIRLFFAPECVARPQLKLSRGLQ